MAKTKSKKLTRAERITRAVNRIEDKRRESFNRELARGYGIANIKGSGAFIRNTHPPAALRPAVKYCS